MKTSAPQVFLILGLFVLGVFFLTCSQGDDNIDDDPASQSDDDTTDDDATSDDDESDDDDDDNDDDDNDDNDDDDCELLYPNLKIAAHRGASLFAPENSIPAIERAFELGAHIVEVDVRHTSDGQYVLMHDDTVDRTTDGSGLVSEMTLAEIQALTISAWQYPWISESLSVPTFAEALQVINANGGQVYVDMKTEEPEGATQVMVDQGLEHICFVYSGSIDKLDRVRSVSTDVRIQPSTSSVAQTQQLIDHFDPDPEHIEIDGESGFSAANIDLIKSVGATVSMDALGVRDILAMLGFKQAWGSMMEGGIDILQTDFPQSLVLYWKSLCVE